jgi:hypothetical protein
VNACRIHPQNMFRSVFGRALRLTRSYAGEAVADAAKSAPAPVARRSRTSLKVLAGVTAVVGTGYGVLQLDRFDGTRRAIRFWVGMIPFVAHYRYTQWKVDCLW